MSNQEQIRKIVEIVLDADRNDELARQLRRWLTVEDMIRMQQFLMKNKQNITIN